jgi:hypothetical protein
MGSIWKETSGYCRQGDATQISHFQSIRKQLAVAGNPFSYVDIVGVTGSIPVAPTTLFNRIEGEPTITCPG